MSATCTHQGCTVAWRSGSKSFQCPCHGAVYDENGNVVAQDPLLYWQIPVYRAAKDKKMMTWPGMPPEDTELKDYLTIHAGSSPWEDKGTGTEKAR